VVIDQYDDTHSETGMPEPRRHFGDRRRGAWPSASWQRWALASALAALAGTTHALTTGPGGGGYWAGIVSSAALTVVAGTIALVQYLRR
jgi:hypothetical protein